ncbi:hypothetical protein [Emticicia sp. 17c]|uniref:hypothetical protein n=1 Tax=Emticicia sp. 17c TaxID=3127704 RepID=UPI00301BAFE8
MEQIWKADFENWKIERPQHFKDVVSLKDGVLRMSDQDNPMVAYSLSSPLINELADLNFTNLFSSIIISADVKLFINQFDNAFISIHNSHNNFWLHYQLFGNPAQVSDTLNSKNLYNIIVPILTFDSQETNSPVRITLKPVSDENYNVLGGVTQIKITLVVDETQKYAEKSFFDVRSLQILGQKGTSHSRSDGFGGNPTPGTSGPKTPPPPTE